MQINKRILWNFMQHSISTQMSWVDVIVVTDVDSLWYQVRIFFAGVMEVKTNNKNMSYYIV